MKVNEQELKGLFPLIHEDGELTDNGKKAVASYTRYKTATIVLGSLFGIGVLLFGIAVARKVADARRTGFVSA